MTIELAWSKLRMNALPTSASGALTKRLSYFPALHENARANASEAT
jgi:hypothetical protein